MKKQELIDLSNWMRGNYVALREIGQALMNANALRGRQILGIADDLDQRANGVRYAADKHSVSMRITYLQKDNHIIVAFVDMARRVSTGDKEDAGIIATFTTHCESSVNREAFKIEDLRKLENADEGPFLDAIRTKWRLCLEHINLIEVDIHTEEFSK